MSGEGVLNGFTVGITADRRAEDQEVLLRRLGAEVVHGPMMRTIKLSDPDVLRDITEQIIGSSPDYLVANTGLGIRIWFAAAADWGLDDGLRAALAATNIVARGPKAAGALVSAGLKVSWRSPSEQLADVTGYLVAEGVAGRTVAFQSHGDDREVLSSTLESAGARILTVPVYRWSVPSEDDAGPARRLIEMCCRGEIDAVTFTAGPQVRNMMELADAARRGGDLLEAFNRGRPLAACIGPVCAGVATGEGITKQVVPDNWRLGSLIKTLAAALTPR